jgi:hypothetical protein
MKKIRSVLTIILLFYFVPTILSTLDILRGSEPDLSSEWIIVSVYMVLSLIYSIVNLMELMKELRKNNG